MPTYPLDTTGFNVSNLVVDELHTMTEVNSSPYRLIIPTYAPFYLDNFSLKHDNGLGVITPLVEGVDYNLSLPYIAASRSIGKMLYGAVSMINNNVNGTIKISYQTIGSSWVADVNYVLERISELLYNPRITVWDIITNVQEIFPPINHDQSADYIYGYQNLITAINNLADTIANGPSGNLPVIQHLIDETNPHNVTKSQIGLSSIVNLPMASDAEVTARTPAEKYVTLRQLVTLAGL